MKKKHVKKRKQKREKKTRGKLQCFKEKTKKTKISTSSIAKIILKKKRKYVKNDNCGKKKKK